MRTLRFPESIYIFKTAGGKKENTPMEQKGLQARMRVIREWVNNPYLTVTNLYFSGILHEAYHLMQEQKVREKGNKYSLKAIEKHEKRLLKEYVLNEMRN